MALLSRKADYALLILSYLHHRPDGGCAREIAERFGLKPAFTANILKLLCRQGLVRSRRGVRGGYNLGKPAQEVILSDILDLLGEPFQFADCVPGQDAASQCSREAICPVRGAIVEVERRLRDVLRTVTLADLVRTPEANGCVQTQLAMLPR